MNLMKSFICFNFKKIFIFIIYLFFTYVEHKEQILYKEESEESRAAVMVWFVFSDSLWIKSEWIVPADSLSLPVRACLKPSSDLMQTCIEQQYSRVGIELRLPPPINLPFMNLSFCLFFYSILWTSRLCMKNVHFISYKAMKEKKILEFLIHWNEKTHYCLNQFDEPNTSNSDVYGSPKKIMLSLTIT